MLIAIAFLMAGFVMPRYFTSTHEVRQARAIQLRLHLQDTYDRWKLYGGLHGSGDPQNPELLTRNLLMCFSSSLSKPYHSPFFKDKLGRTYLGPAGVLERPELDPNPSLIRFEKLTLPADLPDARFSSENGYPRRGVAILSDYGVYFNGNRWEVVPLK